MNGGTQRHCFTYDSDDDQGLSKKLQTKKRTEKAPKPDEQRGFRPHTAGGVKITGDYMKPTVNADLKKLGEKPQPTIAKT